MGGGPWGTEEVAVLASHLGTVPVDDLAYRLGREPAEVRARALALVLDSKPSTCPLGPITAEIAQALRPRTWGECENGPRPCPWVGCRYHLVWEAIRRAMKVPPRKFPKLEDRDVIRHLSKMGDTCALDLVMKRGPYTLHQIGVMWGITRERVRQVEAMAKRSYATAAIRMGQPWLIDLIGL